MAATEKIEVPVEIGGPAAVADVNRLIKAVEGLERVVDKLGPKVDKTDKEVKKVGESAKKTATEWERFRTALGGDIASPRAISDVAKGFNEITSAVQTAFAAVQQLGQAAGRGEDNLRAVNALGDAYRLVSEATGDTVTAQQAFTTQQRLVRSGLQVSGAQLATITRAAREYARATGTEATQATEQLADALVGASADELQKYGITLQAGLDRTTAFTQATRQLAEQQSSASAGTRTMSEDIDRLGTAATEVASAFALMAADGLGLQGIVSGLATSMRDLIRDINEAVTSSRNAQATEVEVSRRQSALEERQGLVREMEARLRTAGVSQEQIASLVPTGANLTRASSGLLRAQNVRLREALENTAAAMPATGDTISAAFMRGQIDARTGTSGTIAGMSQDQLRAQLSGDRIRGSGSIRDALSRQVAGQTTVQQARAQLLATATSLTEELMWSSATAAGEVMQVRGARPAARTASAGSTTDLTTAAMEAAHREAQRLRGTGVSAPNMGTMFEQAAAAQAAAQERAQAARAAGDTRFAGRVSETQRVFSDAAADIPRQAGFFDDMIGADEARRAELLRSQADAMRELVTQVDERIAQAREQGAAESEINGLLSQRVGLVAAVNTADRERAAIERERLAPMRAYRDEMVQGLSAVGNAFVESAALAIEGEEAFGQALQRQMRAIFVSLAKQSAIEALKNTAQGFAALGNPLTAATAPFYFKAAGLWAATGILAGGVAAAIPRPDAATASAGGSSRAPSPAQARAGGGGAGAESGPLVLNITVNGALMNEGVEEGIVRAIDRAATRGVSPRVLRAGRGM
jgi:hypothetical protein